MLRVQLESCIELKRSDLPGAVEKELLRRTTFKDPLFKMHQRKGISTEGLTEKIHTHTVTKTHLFLWRGCIGAVVRVLRRTKVPFELVDNRLWLPKVDLSCSIELRDYQEPAYAVMRRRQQTLFRGEAGSGKTETMLAAASHFGQPTLVLVWQERQQKVWLDRIPEYFKCEVGGVGGVFKKPVYAPITVGMIQSVRNRLDEISPQFGCVLCDEVQRFAAKTLREVINALPAAVRIGASDDERRRDGREFLLYNTFGPKGHQLPKGMGQAPVDIIAVPTRFGYYQRGWRINWNDLTEEFSDSADRNAMVINLACREARAGESVLIWSDRVEHCEGLKKAIVKRGVTAGLLLGTKARKEEADATEAGLRDGTVSVGIGTKVAEQSINVPPLTVGIMTCASADKKMFRFRQMRGRLTRPYEGRAKRLYYLWDKRVSFLRGKINNIRRAGYSVRISRYDERQKERDRMADKAVVTLDTLKAGAKALKLKVPKGATFKKLEQLIQRALAKDKTFGSYACEQCGRDIIDEVPICPYCAGEFKQVGEPVVDEEEFEEAEVEEEAEGEEEEYEDEGEEEEYEDEGEEEEEEEEYEEEEEEEEEGEEEEEEEEEGEEEEEEEEEGEEEEEEEEEEAPAPERRTRKKAPAKKKTPTARKAAADLKERKRAQIREELPYKQSQLIKMKRTALVMVAAELGIKNPLGLGGASAIIEAVTAAQRRKFGKKKVATKKAATRRTPAKTAATKRPAAKKKATRRSR